MSISRTTSRSRGVSMVASWASHASTVGGAVDPRRERLGAELGDLLGREPAPLRAEVDDVTAERSASSSSGGASATTRPLAITATTSQSAASPTYCVETMSVRPSSRSCRKRCQKRSRRIGSMPAVGSSRKTSSGSCTSVSASANRRCMPPDVFRASFVRSAVSSTNSSISRSRRRRPRPLTP